MYCFLFHLQLTLPWYSPCQQTINAIKELPFPIRAILPGAETGVELADQLSHRLGLRSNGIAKSLARRNKYHMGEQVRSAGVRAVTQAMCVTEEEVKKFIRSLPGKNSRSVVKPLWRLRFLRKNKERCSSS